jgi:hypothetical protein
VSEHHERDAEAATHPHRGDHVQFDGEYDDGCGETARQQFTIERGGSREQRDAAHQKPRDDAVLPVVVQEACQCRLFHGPRSDGDA